MAALPECSTFARRSAGSRLNAAEWRRERNYPEKNIKQHELRPEDKAGCVLGGKILMTRQHPDTV
jgi:hypothetical protein